MCRKLIVLCLVVVFCSSAGATVIHQWSMEEGSGGTTANTGTMGAGHDGTIYGLSWTGGLNGTTAALDHERDNWGEAVDIPTIQGDITGSFTVEAWIKAESWAESWQGPIFSNMGWVDTGTPDDGLGQNYGFQLRAGARNDQAGWDPTKAVLGFVIAGQDHMWQDQDSLASGIFLDLNTEHHVKGTYDAVTGIMAIYIDGVHAGQRTHLLSFQDSFQISEIGRDPLTAQRFDGIIDEVRIYAVPEPATVCLFGFGALVLLKRKC